MAPTEINLLYLHLPQWEGGSSIVQKLAWPECDFFLATNLQSWAQLPLSVEKSIVHWSVDQRNSTYF